MAIDEHTFINALKEAKPQCANSDEDGEHILSVFSTVVVNALKNSDTVYLKGIGEWRTEPDGNRKKVVFAADRILMDGVNE